jgi:hypothetical protein
MKRIMMFLMTVGIISIVNAQVNTGISNQKPAGVANKPVVTQPQKPVDKFGSVIGNLKFTSNHFAFVPIKNNVSKTDTLRIRNDWNKTMTFTLTGVPAYIKAEVVPTSLEPGKEGLIVCTYDAKARNDWGFIQDRFTLSTNDSITPQKQIIVSAQIEEFFPKMTSADSANAPRINFAEKIYDYGTIKQGTMAHKDYTFTNTGKSNLIIHKTKASCGCTASKPDKLTVAPGETSVIKVDFNSSGKHGKQSKTVTVITNDPITPSVVLTIKGEVEAPAKTASDSLNLKPGLQPIKKN